jgi:hypothetical protein
MYGPRLCNEYIEGVDAFIDLVKKDILNNIRGNLYYPCKHCKNEKRYRTDDVLRSYLIKHGFMDDYRTLDALKLVGKSCIELHNYYINSYHKVQDIIVLYKNRHFLVGDGIFLISWSDLYDLFNLDALHVGLMRCFTL